MISRAENEVDSLEIVVEAEANKANRAMTSLEKKINKVAESLERCMLIAQGSVSLKGIDVDKLFAGDAMSKAAKTSGKKLADDLIKNFNLSLAGADVQNQVKSLTNKISKGISDGAGKPYKGLSNDIEALGKLTAKNGPESFVPYQMQSSEEAQADVDKWVDNHGFTNIKNGADSASKSVGTFESQIKQLKAELSDLSLKGFSQYDFEYDKVAQELATITAAKKQYDAEMKNRGKAELGNEQAKATGENLRKARKELTLFERALNGIKGSAKNMWY